ncbi:sortase [Phototrophicus methaneseepsis]|uniref:Sortase n=1 Tax=Phototrophicus methaneseepsis TaxID=2710758 RepID=A0A7S8ED40_9CHLR|nr:sortase [Phototrophicus methaneseepsis]QPC84741.1 sortase [Phototrophicus methaneseepsis]
MYGRRRRSSGSTLLVVIVIAVIIGVVFSIMDNEPDALPAAEASPATEVAVQPTVETEPLTQVDSALSASTATDMPTIPPMPTETLPDTPSDTATEPGQVNIQDYLPEIPEGTSLFIPSAGVYAPVVQAYLSGTSWDVSQLGENVGHLQGTAWINDPGNVVLSGHVELGDGRRGVFANLNELKVNDIIVVISPERERRYVITNISSTTPDNLQPIKPTTSDRLTLITCGSYDFFQDTYLERLIVVAEPI